MMTTPNDLHVAIKAAGGKDPVRCFESLRLAVLQHGESIDEMIASLRKWQPGLFRPMRAIREEALETRERNTKSLRDYRKANKRDRYDEQ